jgi:hypothetical protein
MDVCFGIIQFVFEFHLYIVVAFHLIVNLIQQGFGLLCILGTTLDDSNEKG